MKFNTRYNPPPKITQAFTSPSLTVQSEKDRTDVHNILNRYVATGDLGYFGIGAPAKPFYGDFSSAPDFQESMNMQVRAREYFDGLPSHMRLKFGNDYREMIRFLGNDENHEKAVELGLLEKIPEVVKETIQQTQQAMPSEANGSVPQPQQNDGTAV